jgi:hypothetical protein
MKRLLATTFVKPHFVYISFYLLLLPPLFPEEFLWLEPELEEPLDVPE